MRRQYQFGPFLFDPIQRVLTQSGESVGLPPKVLVTLRVLLENHGRVVSKDELTRAVWQGTNVGENSLSQNIFLLRKALGEGYIETVPKSGYRFTAPVKAVESSGGWVRLPLRWAACAGIVLAAIAVLSIDTRVGSASFSKGTRNSEAYQLYLRARVQFWDQVSPEALRNSIDSFERALAKDPGFAPGWAALADCYTNVVYYGVHPNYREWIPKARAAALRAVKLDDRLAGAHTALANVKFRYDWDWAGAETEYKRALRLDPAFAIGHVHYGVYLTAMGRFEEGIAESNRAHQLDPLSSSIELMRGWNLALAGRYDEAIAQYQGILRRDPNYARAHQYLGFVYSYEKLTDQEVTEDLAWLASAGQDQRDIEAMREAYRAAGLPGYIAKKRELTHTLARQRIQLGDKDGALADLETRFRNRNPTMVFLKVHPQYDPLRSDPRFKDLLRRMGLD